MISMIFFRQFLEYALNGLRKPFSFASNQFMKYLIFYTTFAILFISNIHNLRLAVLRFVILFGSELIGWIFANFVSFCTLHKCTLVAMFPDRLDGMK